MPFVLLLLLALLGGCDRSDAPPALEDGAGAPAPAGVYERWLVFLAGDPADPAGAAFSFRAVQDSTGLRRRAGAWRASGASGWTALADLAWEMTPMREPWRLVPHGPLRLLVGEDEEIETIVLREQPELRLLPGRVVAEWSAGDHEEVALREAQLRSGDGLRAGHLFDARRAAAPATPPAGRAAYLAGADGIALVVLAASETGSAWLRRAGGERSWDAVRLVPLPGGGPAAGWRLEAEGEAGPLRAEIRTDPAADPGTLRAATGWIELDGRRVPLHGVVRPESSG